MKDEASGRFGGQTRHQTNLPRLLCPSTGRPLGTGRSKDTGVTQGAKAGATPLVMPRIRIPQLLFCELLGDKGGRLQGKRWCRSACSCGDVAWRDGTFFNREKGLPGVAVKEEDKTCLCSLCDSVDFTFPVPHPHEDWWRREIVVPQVMMNRLEMPAALPGFRIEGDDGVGKQIRTFAIDADKIGTGGADGEENEPARGRLSSWTRRWPLR